MEPTGQPESVLSLEELLVLTLEFEKWPLLAEAPLSRNNARTGQPETVNIPRGRVITSLAKLPGMNGLPENFFTHASGWQTARITVLTMLEAKLEDRQPTSQELVRWQEEKDRINLDKRATITRHVDWKKITEKYAQKEGAPELADTLNREKLEAKTEPASLTQIKDRVATIAVSSSAPPPAATRPTRARDYSLAGMSWQAKLKEILRNPFVTVYKLLKSTRQQTAEEIEIVSNLPEGRLPVKATGSWLQRLSGRFLNRGKNTAGQAARGVVSEVGRKAIQGMGKTAVKAGLTVATGGTVGVILKGAAFLSRAIPSETKRKFEDLLSQLKIWGKKLLLFMLANPVGLMMASAALIFGGPLGIFLAGPAFILGAGIQGVVLNILGFGGGSAAGGLGISAATGAGANALATAGAGATGVGAGTMSVGGLTVSSLSGAAGSIGGVLGGTGIMAVTAISIVGSIVALWVTVAASVVTIIAAQPPEKPGDIPTNLSAGSIFKVDVTADRTSLPDFDGTAREIHYTLTITPVSGDVTVRSVTEEKKIIKSSLTASLGGTQIDPATLQKNGDKFSKSYSFSIAGDQYKDSSLIMTLTVAAQLVSDPEKMEVLSDSVTVILGKPVYTGSCSFAPDSSPCSVANLLPYFDNDQTRAENASRICNAESHGNKDKINDGCTRNPVAHNEYSIGLFQINLYAHDKDLVKKGWCPAGMFTDPYVPRVSGDACSRNAALLEECRETMTDPEKNIKYAYELSKKGTNWSAWSTAAPQYCNIH